MTIQQAKKIYFIGIGGIGMSALATVLQGDQKIILGSDSQKSFITERCEAKGMTVFYTQDAKNMPEKIDLYIYSDAVPEDHPERVFARLHDIPQMQYFEALGEYMHDFEYAIAVSGTHGKTTTTALIANILVAANLDPTVIVGSVVPELQSNARVGGKKILVVEACEHNAHMLHLRPDMIVLTNIEADHLDYYRDIEHIRDTFQEYLSVLPKDGVVIVNADDPVSMELSYATPPRTYGIEKPALLPASDVTVRDQRTHFTIENSVFSLAIPGLFNVSNALAAIAVARFFDVPDDTIRKVLESFHGVWRRFQYIGLYKEASVYSDYAHHPTAITATIQAARDFFPNRRIVVVFQPHQRARTKKLFNDFVSALSDADLCIVQEIYDVAGRESQEYQSVSSTQIVAELEKNDVNAFFTENEEETRRSLDEQIEPHDVVLIMGAGDIYQLAEKLSTEL